MTETVPQHLRALREFCDRVPGHRRNSRTHLSTLIRWATRGVKTPDGNRVRLRAVRAGAKWLTTDEWFALFLDALTTASQPSDEPHLAPVRTPAARDRASVQSDQKLKEPPKPPRALDLRTIELAVQALRLHREKLGDDRTIVYLVDEAIADLQKPQ